MQATAKVLQFNQLQEQQQKQINIQKIQQEFQEKNLVLQEHYTEINAFDFLVKNFLKNDIIIAFKEDSGIIKITNEDELLQCMDLNNVYMFYHKFFKGYVKRKLLRSTKFLVVDLDNVSTNDLRFLVTYPIARMKIKPTYILNSGTGLHLIFELKQEIQLYKRTVNIIAKLNYLNQYRFKKHKAQYKVDILPLIHAFRIPGSLSKYGQKTRMFQVSGTVSILELAEYLGLKKQDIQLLQDQESYQLKKITKTKTKTKTKKQQKQNNIIQIGRGYIQQEGRTFYEYMLNRTTEIQVGNRYLFMFCISVVAWKYRISYNQLKEDLKNVMNYFNSRDCIKIKEEEINKALRGYSHKFIYMTWERIAMYCGFHPSYNKRNGRTQKEHLKFAREIRKIRQEYKKKDIEKRIQYYLSKNFTVSHIAERLGMSRQNLYATYGNIIKQYKKNSK